MKRLIFAMAVLASVVCWSASAMAATYSFDYLFTGTSTLNGEPEKLFDAPVNLSFDSDAAAITRGTPASGDVSYFIPFSNVDHSGLSLTVGRTNLFDLLDFNYNTFAQIDLVGGVLDALDVSLNFVQSDIMEFTRAKIELQMDPVSLNGFFDFYIQDNWTGDVTSGTGAIDGTLSAPTPIPGAAILLGSGLLGLVGLRRRTNV